MISRLRDFIGSFPKVVTVTIIAFILVLYFLIHGCKKRREKPNILFIMSDDHSIHAIGAYNGFLSDVAPTPNLDKIAEEGILFQNCIATNAICEPSRAAILTGKYAHINGVINNGIEFDGTQQTFPKILQKGGYQTAIIGKWHLKTQPTGFDYWNILPGQGDYYNPVMIEMGERKEYEGHVTDIIANQVLDWLMNRNSNKPFFLMWNPKAPHRTWMPDTDYITMYDTLNIPEPKTLFDDYSTRCPAAREQQLSVANNLLPASDLKIFPSEQNTEINKTIDPIAQVELDRIKWERFFGRLNEKQKEKWRKVYGPRNRKFREYNLKGKELIRYKYQRYIKDYLRCIASVDENVGRVMKYLREAGILDNTLVIYTSDQGFFLGEHGWFDKRFMYEETIHMPLLARLPGEIPPGEVNNDLVLNIDFASTILDYANVNIPDDMQGHSIRPLLRGKSPEDWRTSMYYHYYEFPAAHMVKRHYGIRTQQYKLIHFYHDIGCWELYDLKKDPQELNNLYDNPKYRDIVKRLKEELEELQKKLGDSDSLAIELIKKYPGQIPEHYSR